MFADYHTHTEFSDDSDYRMEQAVEDAIAMGMDEICFTDHVDYGIKKDWDEPGGMIYRKGETGEPDEMPLANVHYPTYIETYNGLQYLYGDRISLKLGLEFGMQTHTIDRYRELFVKYPFDFLRKITIPLRSCRLNNHCTKQSMITMVSYICYLRTTAGYMRHIHGSHARDSA